MKTEPAATSPSAPRAYPPAPAESNNTSSAAEGDQISQNIEAILEYYARQELNISRSQRFAERVSDFIGRPVFLGFILLFVTLWITGNLALQYLGMEEFDPAPYFWLQGIVSLCALLTANVVLAKQNRFAKTEEQRAHLDLKVTLLTEQKAAKLIELIEELRRDLPNVRDRHDAEATSLTKAMNPDRVLAALDERTQLDDREKPLSSAGEPGRGKKDAV